MVIAETQEIENPEIENHSGFSVLKYFSPQKGAHNGTPFLVVQDTSFDVLYSSPSYLF